MVKGKLLAITLLSIAGASPSRAEPLDFAPMALNSFTLLPAQFPSARVLTTDRLVIGNVQGIERGPQGQPTVIHIGIAGANVISLRSMDASYDQANNVVIADATAVSETIKTSQRR